MTFQPMAQARKSNNLAGERSSTKSSNLKEKSILKREEDKLLVLVGGWPDDTEGEPYSVVSVKPCELKLPPLPKKYMWDPLVELVQHRMLLCNIDYDQYILDRRVSYGCWGLNFAKPSLSWKPFPPPPKKLFLSTSASWRGQLAIIGGSQSHHSDLSLLRGTTHLQLYNPRRGSWSQGPEMPAPLFEGCAVPVRRQGLLVLGDFEAGETNMYLLTGPGGEWRAMPESRHYHSRPGCAVASLDGRNEGLVVVTGDHTEFFSFTHQRWIELPDRLSRRAATNHVSIGMSQGRLVRAGGWDDLLQEKSHVVEAWEEGRGWVPLATQLKVGRTRQAELELPASLCKEQASLSSHKTANRTSW